MKKPNHAGSGQIRIIGGNGAAVNYRCRRARACGRPPTGFAKPFLTGWRRPLLTRTASIAFAGSGALGLEALSRYAASTTLLEMERGVAQQLQKNLATLKADRGKVITTNTLSFLSQPGTPHQIVFVDPPFRQGLLEETLRLLETQGWLADEALVYVESEVENGLPPVPANWQLYREKVAGQVAYRLYQREAQGEHHAD